MLNKLLPRGFAAGVAALAAPFMFSVSLEPGLAGECKQVPPPNRAYSDDLSQPPVLSSQARPSAAQASRANCPPRDGVDVLLDSQRELYRGLIEGAERARRLREQVPGG